MKLTKHKLGEFVELYVKKCDICNLTCDDVSGINKDKEFFEPSKQVGGDTTDYKVVPPNYFACNLMHVGRDKVLPIALNYSNNVKNVSPAYTVFSIKEGKKLLREYFFMMLKSNEKDRYFWFNTDSSVRDGMSWEDFCELEITLPNVCIQQKYVNIYVSMLENQRSYERGINDLKLICDAYVDNNISKKCYCKLGDYIKINDERNVAGKLGIDDIRGFDVNGDFIAPKRTFSGDIKTFKIISTHDFVYNPRIPNITFPVALNNGNMGDILVSPAYVTFNISRPDLLDDNYLLMIMQRSSFSRKVLFNTWGSSTPFFRHDDLCEFEIPVIDLDQQKSIAAIYESFNKRRYINERLKTLIKDICPILIKGSLEESR